ncbi:sensor histidine kinase [Deinococcus sp. Arct2-2]|uniref:sensor histidine kinase n=1 Tax=Deinococcus sp. Arct2-2 TaxID=2568653 RepID=UPI001454D75B|nr:sensor histidine kinase [Deinococcus sp. Arct2-2]
MTPTAPRLRWKLTVSYALVTISALLALELLLVLSLALWFFAQAQRALPMAAAQVASVVAPEFAALQGSARQLVLEARLATFRKVASEPTGTVLDFTLDAQAGSLIVVDNDGQVLSALGGPPRVVLHLPRLPPSVVAQARRGTFVFTAAGPVVWSAAAVRASSGRVIGAVLVEVRPTLQHLLGGADVLPLMSISAGLITLFAMPVGALFGFLSARPLVRRLSDLALVSQSWSRGDFARRADERASDELGLLARHLNRMASEVQRLVQARQELAAAEERHRLARDLHDSVKQQLFAAAMHVGAARMRLAQEPVQAAQHLDDVTALLHQSQRELAELLSEWRPLNRPELGLVLREHVEAWARRTDVSVESHVVLVPLPPHIERALLLVVGEALANVARHSRASSVNLRVHADAAAVNLTVSDDGIGFTPTAAGIGIGLDSMRARVEALGGAFEISGMPGKGTRVVAHIPVNVLSASGAQVGEEEHRL